MRFLNTLIYMAFCSIISLFVLENLEVVRNKGKKLRTIAYKDFIWTANGHYEGHGIKWIEVDRVKLSKL